MIPEPFQHVLNHWREEGIPASSADWTDRKLMRHVGAVVNYHSKPAFAKMALAEEADLDEPNRREGIRREVWWCQIMKMLQTHCSPLPFLTPAVIHTNVDQELVNDQVSWVMFEYLGIPSLKGEELVSTRLDDIVRSLLVLDQIDLSLLQKFGLPALPPFLPHGSRGPLDWFNRRLPLPRRIKDAITRWLEKRTRARIIAHDEQYCLGNGAFEPKNFLENDRGELVIIDNEFAGWYPRYYQLAYLYHRLYCTSLRPDLAERLLDRYITLAFPTARVCAFPDFSQALQHFWTSFTRILRARLISGWCNDTLRRRLPPWHTKQRLRYKLWWAIMDGDYGKLLPETNKPRSASLA